MLLLTRKILNQVVSHHVESSTVATITWLIATEYLFQKWPHICCVCHSHNPVLSSYMIYHRVLWRSNTTGATYGVGTVYPSGKHEFTPGVLWDSCFSALVFCVMLGRSFWHFVLFFVTTALSVLLWFMASH